MTRAANLAEAAGSGFAFRNRIINGDMRIDQRNAGALGSPAIIGYYLDRWTYYQSQSSKGTIGQNAGSVTPPPGFTNYLGFTSTSSYSLTATDQFCLSQPIEGYNVADLAWGTSNAKTVTLSFWVYSSLTGTFGGSIQNSAQNRCYPFSFNVASANTWTYCTVVIPGDTTGTWLTNNGVGIRVWFSAGTGSTYSGTAGAWSGSSFLTSVTGAVSVVGTNGATFYITGVQLEKGSVATPFENRIYSNELAMCMRYFERIGDGSNRLNLGMFVARNTTQGDGVRQFSVQKRAVPTITINNPTWFRTIGYNLGAGTTLSIGDADNLSFAYICTGTSYIAGYGNYVQSGDAQFPSIFCSAEL